MNPKLKKKWVKALMSGKYEQTRGQLKFLGGYCCLGVLADVAGFESANSNYLKKLNGIFALLPFTVQAELADLNDEEIPFPVIAGFIQENL